MPPLPGHTPIQTSGPAQAELAQQGPERLADPDVPDTDRGGAFRPGLRTKIAVATGALLSSFAIIAPGGAIAEENPRAAGPSPVPEAQQSARRGKGMQPAGVMKGIRRVLLSVHGTGADRVENIYLAKLTPKASSLQGKCTPKDGWFSKSRSTRNGKLFSVYCVGQKSSSQLPTPTNYSNGLDRLGNRAASSAGISAESRGSTTKATATPRRAVIRFANDDTQAEARQLKALVLRKGKKPTKRWYPAQQSPEAQR